MRGLTFPGKEEAPSNIFSEPSAQLSGETLDGLQEGQRSSAHIPDQTSARPTLVNECL